MKNVLKITLISLSIAYTNCSALNDMKTDLKAMYTKTLPQEATDQLTELFQGFTFFSYKKGYKYPGFINYEGGPNNWITTMLCGTKIDGRVFLVRTPDELESLIPVRKFGHENGPNMKTDEKYDGYCETSFGKAIYRLAHLTFLKKKEYKGKILVDEYNAEYPKPFYFSLGNIEDLRGLKSYLAKHLMPKEIKPLLLLKIDKQEQEELTNDDKTFWTSYFTLLDPKDSLVIRFFETTNDALSRAQDKFGPSDKGARAVGEKFGDLLMGEFFSNTGEFKYEVMAINIVKVVAAAWGIKTVYEYTKKESSEKMSDNVHKGLKYAAIGTAGVVGTAFIIAWLNELTEKEPLTRTKKAPKAA